MMKKAAVIFSIWALSVFGIPIVLALVGSNTALTSLITGFVASFTMFMLFCPYVNSLLRRTQEEDEDFSKEDDDLFDFLENREVRRLWRQKIDEISLQNLSEKDLFPSYRRLMLALWDSVDPYFSERLVNEPPSEILRLGNRTKRFSFRKFCKNLGR